MGCDTPQYLYWLDEEDQCYFVGYRDRPLALIAVRCFDLPEDAVAECDRLNGADPESPTIVIVKNR